MPYLLTRANFTIRFPAANYLAKNNCRKIMGSQSPDARRKARAIQAGEQTFSVVLNGDTYTQAPQKYHAKSLEALKRKYRALADRSRLDPILAAADCTRYLA